jgi:hypothetical protein
VVLLRIIILTTIQNKVATTTTIPNNPARRPRPPSRRRPILILTPTTTRRHRHRHRPRLLQSWWVPCCRRKPNCGRYPVKPTRPLKNAKSTAAAAIFGNSSFRVPRKNKCNRQYPFCKSGSMTTTTIILLLETLLPVVVVVEKEVAVVDEAVVEVGEAVDHATAITTIPRIGRLLLPNQKANRETLVDHRNNRRKQATCTAPAYLLTYLLVSPAILRLFMLLLHLTKSLGIGNCCYEMPWLWGRESRRVSSSVSRARKCLYYSEDGVGQVNGG